MARPRRNAIDRFNIATNLTGERKLSKFVAVSGLTTDRAWLTCARFWDFVAVNYALDGDIFDMGTPDEIIINPKLEPEDKYALKVHCWFDGDPDELIKLLQTSGFLDEDLTIHEWFTHQPLAEKLLRKRIAGAKGGKQNVQSGDSKRSSSGTFIPSKSAETIDVLGVKEGFPPISTKPTPNSELRTPNSESPITETEDSLFVGLPEPKPTSKKNQDQDNIADDWLHFWNNMVCKECPELAPVKGISGERLKHLKISLKKQGFDKDSILEAIKKSLHARGTPYPGSERTWTISFDNLIGKPDRQGGKNIEKYFIHLLEGKYEPKNAGLSPAEAAIIAELEGDLVMNKYPEEYEARFGKRT